MTQSLKTFAVFVAALSLSGCATSVHINGPALPSSLAARRVSIGKISYIPLSAVVQELNAQQSWDPESQTATINAGTHEVRLAPLIKTAIVDGVAQDLAEAPLIESGELLLPQGLWDKWFVAWAPAVPRPPLAVARSVKTIVLDAGHGGKDAGAISKNGLQEKKVNLDIALRLREILEKDGFRVIMTRSDDRFLSLERRAEIANEAGADMFISIHANASKRRSSSGFEVYYLSEATDDHARALESVENGDKPVDTKERLSADTQVIVWDLLNSAYRAESRHLADAVSRGLRAARVPFEDRGVKSARFAVLKGSRMPAILVEVGFITNPSEGASLKTADYRQRLADGIGDGIGTYHRVSDEHGNQL